MRSVLLKREFTLFKTVPLIVFCKLEIFSVESRLSKNHDITLWETEDFMRPRTLIQYKKMAEDVNNLHMVYLASAKDYYWLSTNYYLCNM